MLGLAEAAIASVPPIGQRDPHCGGASYPSKAYTVPCAAPPRCPISMAGMHYSRGSSSA
jgi:hypothetical protein